MGLIARVRQIDRLAHAPYRFPGSFEIIASQEQRPGNWSRMMPDTSQILVRQTFLDRATEHPVDQQIECLERQGDLPPLDPAAVRGQLLGGAMYAIGCPRIAPH